MLIARRRARERRAVRVAAPVGEASAGEAGRGSGLMGGIMTTPLLDGNRAYIGREDGTPPGCHAHTAGRRVWLAGRGLRRGGDARGAWAQEACPPSPLISRG